MSTTEKPRRKFPEHWGNIPQWISAIAAAGILYLTVTGLRAAKPIFENATLREENAQLRLDVSKNLALVQQAKQAVAAQSATTWRYVCRHYAAKARAAAAPGFMLGSFDPAEAAKLKESFPILTLQTGAELLRSKAIRDDLEMLSQAEQTRFDQLVETFIKDNGPVMTASLQPGAAAGAAPAEVDRAKQARQAFDLAMQSFLAACTAAAPAVQDTTPAAPQSGTQGGG